jgi:hypothetical protein
MNNGRLFLQKLERATGFEPATASLEGWNSTTELRPHVIDVGGTRKCDTNSLEGFVLPAQSLDVPASSKLGMVGRQGFEPWKPMATDLQSAPFVHLGTCPNIKPYIQFLT